MKGFLSKAMPFLLIVFGLLTLNMFQGLVSITCMVIGIVMLFERRWPEKWGTDKDNGTIIDRYQDI